MKNVCFITAIFCSHFCVAQLSVRQAQAWYEKGEHLYTIGSYDKALHALNTCLQHDATYYEAYTSRAAAKERLGDWEGAIIDYTIYLYKFPESRDVFLNRGLARYQAAKFSDARNDFLQAKKLPPAGETTLFYRQSMSGEGTDQVMSSHSDITDQLFNYIGLCELNTDNSTQAVIHFDSAIMLNPHEPDYYAHRGQAYEQLGDLAKAEASYRHALELDYDHAISHHNLGIILTKRGSIPEAEAQYTESIKRNPNYYFTYLERAYYRQEKKDWKGALVDYNKAIDLKNTDVDSWINRGLVKEKLNDLQGAYIDFSTAIKLKESSAKAWLCRGNVLGKLNKLDAARDDYTVAIFYNPQYGNAYFNRAVVYQRLGKLTEACDDVHRSEALGLRNDGKLKAKVCR